MSDSSGYIVDKNGINLDTVKKLKEVERRRIKKYKKNIKKRKKGYTRDTPFRYLIIQTPIQRPEPTIRQKHQNSTTNRN